MANSEYCSSVMTIFAVLCWAGFYGAWWEDRGGIVREGSREQAAGGTISE